MSPDRRFSIKDGIGKKSNENLSSLSTKELIQKFGGWNAGHFIFRTGEHGNGYVDKMGFLRYPEAMTEIGRRLAEQYRDMAEQIDVVVGPSIIGAVLAYSVANQLGVPYTVTYRRDEDIHFHRGFVPELGSKCLFVDDFVFSGKDLRDNVQFMQKSGMEVIGASVVGVREEVHLPVPLKNLIKVDFVKTPPESCQLCKSGVPVTDSNIRE